MNNNKKVLALLLTALVLFIGFWNLKVKNDLSPIQNERVVQEFKASLMVEDGKTNPTFDVRQYIGKTALEATQLTLQNNLKVTGKDDKAFVTSLNGRDADTKKHEFWELVVNGKQAEVGAGSYKIQNGDTIIWKISTY